MKLPKLVALLHLALLSALVLVTAGPRSCAPVPVDCAGACAFEGERRCAPDGVEECRATEDGCVVWTLLGSCGDWAVCDDGVCGAAGVLPGACIQSQDGGDGVVDFGAPDGVPDDIWSFTYDDAGQLVREENDGPRGIRDSPPDGAPDYAAEYVYDDRGLVVLKDEWDSPGEQVWWRTTWEYDAGGRVLRILGDVHADGVVDRLSTYSYSEDGRAVEEHFDPEADGERGPHDWCFLYEYDAGGRLLRESGDPGCDGILSLRQDYTYDERGLLSLKAIDGAPVHREVDGVYDALIAYFYDEDGRLVRQEIDGDADGITEYWTHWLYDETSGPVAILQWYANDDGTRWYCFEREHDGVGNVLSETYDLECDGVIDGVMTWSYDCWLPRFD